MRLAQVSQMRFLRFLRFCALVLAPFYVLPDGRIGRLLINPRPRCIFVVLVDCCPDGLLDSLGRHALPRIVGADRVDPEGGVAQSRLRSSSPPSAIEAIMSSWISATDGNSLTRTRFAASSCMMRATSVSNREGGISASQPQLGRRPLPLAAAPLHRRVPVMSLPMRSTASRCGLS